MILVDSTGKLWSLMISVNGILVVEPLTPQPSVLISDPTGGKWQIGVAPTGALTTTKVA